MVDVITDSVAGVRPKLDVRPNVAAIILFLALLGSGVLFTAYSLQTDIVQSGMPIKTWLPFLLLAVALLIALGFEFVNGLHDTANAVATVIYTHSMLQKGMGLIMLILIGTVPMAYALNRTPSPSHVTEFKSASAAAAAVIESKAAGHSVYGNPRPAVSAFVSARKINEGTYPSLAVLVREISKQVETYGSVAKLPGEIVSNTRNDMYLASEAVRFVLKDKEYELSKEEAGKLSAYKKSLHDATRFIPLWVKVAVAIALGLGTMIGWKRIVVTAGEKIGKSHLTYAQGAAAEIVAAGTIGAADFLGLPVSTTHVLSSGVAGTMAAIRLAAGDRAQSVAGLGADTPDGYRALGRTLLPASPAVLKESYWLGAARAVARGRTASSNLPRCGAPY